MTLYSLFGTLFVTLIESTCYANGEAGNYLSVTAITKSHDASNKCPGAYQIF